MFLARHTVAYSPAASLSTVFRPTVQTVYTAEQRRNNTVILKLSPQVLYEVVYILVRVSDDFCASVAVVDTSYRRHS